MQLLVTPTGALFYECCATLSKAVATFFLNFHPAELHSINIADSNLREGWKFKKTLKILALPRRGGTVGQFKPPCGRIRSISIFPLFGDIIPTFCYHHNGTPTRQHFCVDSVARRRRRRGNKARFLLKNLLFFTLHPYNHHFVGSDRPNSMGVYLPNILT